MNPDLERLITLQRLDSSIHDADRRIADEPARRQALDERLAAARAVVEAAKAGLAENQNERRAVEKELALHQGRLSKFRDQLMAVKTNIEYQAMQKEIEFAQHEVRTFEDRILELMLAADDHTAKSKQAEAALKSTEREVEGDRRTLSADMDTLRSTLVRLGSERQAVVSSLAPHLFSTFDGVSKRRQGIAVAEARDGICTICHVRLRPQVFNTILRNEEIIQCESCTRILYFVPRQPLAIPPVTSPPSA
jgi:hypothetical protein